MAVINTNLTCELQQAVKVQYLNGNLFSQDNQGNQINVAVFDGGEPATLGGSVTANVLLSDGSTVPATGGTIAGNVVSITLPAAAYAVPGVASIIVKVTADGVVTTVAALVANVYKSSTDTVIDPGTIIPSVQALIDDIAAAVATIPADYSALWETLAPAYSNTSTYALGRYVTYNGNLYRCTTAVTTAGDWSTNSGHFTAAKIGNDLADLKSATPTLYFGDAIQLEADDNLDNIKMHSTSKYGRYGSYRIVSTAAVEGKPTGFSGAGRLFVMSAQQAGRYVQVLIDASATPKTWIRYFNGNAWTNWHRFIDDIEFAGLIGTVPTGETVEGQISSISQALVADSLLLQDISSKMPKAFVPLDLATDATKVANGIQGVVGEEISIRETPSYTHFILTGTAGKKYRVVIRTSSSSNYPNYIFGTDANDIVTELLGSSTTASEAKEFIVQLGSTSTKMYVLVYSAPADTNGRIAIYEGTTIDAAPQIAEDLAYATADATMKNREINTAYINNTIAGVQRTVKTSRDELGAGTNAVTVKHIYEKNRNMIRFTFITDTHKGGTRTDTYDPTGNINGFVKCSNSRITKDSVTGDSFYYDFAVFGGDIITNYYNPTNMQDLAAAKTAIAGALSDYSSLSKPFLITKGNHDMGINSYVAVETPSSYTAGLYVYYSETGTYVAVKDAAEFADYVAQGATFYTQSVLLMSNAEYQQLIGSYLPVGVQYGSENCGYYYYDVRNAVRVIVLNNYFVYQDGTSYGIDDTQKQFVATAMTGAIASGLAVVTISHSSYGGLHIATQVTDFINAGGVYIGHIHGHTHADDYTNSLGFGNIGVNWGDITIDNKNGHSGFAFDSFEIDLDAKRLYEIRTGAYNPLYRTVDRVFDFSRQLQIV